MIPPRVGLALILLHKILDFSAPIDVLFQVTRPVRIEDEIGWSCCTIRRPVCYIFCRKTRVSTTI